MPSSTGRRPNLVMLGDTIPWITQSDPWYGKAVGKSWREATAMRIEWQIGFWIGAFLLLVLLLWLFSGVLLPFAAAVALGYLLDARWHCNGLKTRGLSILPPTHQRPA